MGLHQDAENIRRGSDWCRSLWRVDSVAPRETRAERGASRSVRPGALASQLGGRDAHPSHGIRRGRAVHALVAAIAHRVERFLSGGEAAAVSRNGRAVEDRKSTRLNSSHGYISYAVFCLKK